MQLQTPEEFYQCIVTRGWSFLQGEIIIWLNLDAHSRFCMITTNMLGYTPIAQTAKFIEDGLTHEACPEDLHLSFSINVPDFRPTSSHHIAHTRCENNLHKAIVSSLVSALCSGKCKPKLSISFRNLSLDSEDAIALATAIAHPLCPPQLHLDFFAQQDLGNVGFMALANALSRSHGNVSLNLGCCIERKNRDEYSDGIMAFANGLASGQWKSGLSLNLSSNNLSAHIFIAFAIALLRGCPQNFSLFLGGQEPSWWEPRAIKTAYQEQIGEAFGNVLRSDRLPHRLTLSLSNVFGGFMRSSADPIMSALYSFTPEQLAQNRLFIGLGNYYDAPHLQDEIERIFRNARIVGARIKYRQRLRPGDVEVCCICQEQSYDGLHRKMILVECGHVLGSSCIDTWERRNGRINKCFYCRSSVECIEPF